ncbi:MAG TPA: NIPSNAP family protein [Silvibacterium sp.]|nr:NIPSNAP family protein [Silvibacterium sp.]
MKRRALLQSIPALPLLAASALAQPIGDAVYELRMYTVYPGKLNAVLERFRFHSMALFERHGMRNIAYWTVISPIGHQPSLVYIVAHASLAAAEVSWKAFEADPDWQKVRDASEAHGQLVSDIQSLFLKPTDFSPHFF